MFDLPQLPSLIPQQTPSIPSLPIGTNVVGGTVGALTFVGNGTGAGPFLQHTGTDATWDATNKRLGIGVAAPTQALDVAGTAKISTRLGVGITPTDTLTVQGKHGMDGGATVGLSNGSYFMRVGGEAGSNIVMDYFQIQARNAGAAGNLNLNPLGGNVGIGLSPSFALDVAGAANISSGNAYKIASSNVLTATALGSGVTGSSLTSVGTITSGVWNGTAITVANGGTGATSFGTTNGVIQYDGTKLVAASQLIFAGGNLSINAGGSPSFLLQLGLDSAAKPSTNTWTISSDARAKDKIRPYTDGLDVLRKLQPKQWVWNGLAGSIKGDPGVGFVAQESARHARAMFQTRRRKLAETDDKKTDVWEYNGHNLPFILVNAVKELDARLTALEAKR